MATRIRRWFIDSLVLFAVSIPAAFCPGTITGYCYPRGEWPATWPKELEPYRDEAITARMDGDTIYRIQFDEREEFERLWPVIAGLRDPNGSLILCNGHRPAVLIHAPPEPRSIGPRGRNGQSVPPWPESAHNPDGSLPECVVWSFGFEKWVPSEARIPEFAACRAQTAIGLMVDGEVIDLNRIRLPKDARILDYRSLGSHQQIVTASRPAAVASADEDEPITRSHDVLHLLIIPRRDPPEASIEGTLNWITATDAQSEGDATKKADERERLKTAIFRFVQMWQDGKHLTADDVKALILATIEPDTWEPAGGPSRIQVRGDRLIIHHTNGVHEKIRRFIKELHSLPVDGSRIKQQSNTERRARRRVHGYQKREKAGKAVGCM